MAKIALSCIACGRELRNVSDDATNQPYCGTVFASYGHYGSTVFDPMDGHYLEINVCDLCLVQHQDRVLTGRDSRPVKEDGVIVGLEQIDPPLRLVAWHVKGSELDWINRQARKEFGLAVDDEPEAIE